MELTQHVHRAERHGARRRRLRRRSLVYQRLPGRSGTVSLDALKLGLASSSQYNVRVLPVGRDGQAAGQASPSSTLNVDDGVPPAGRQVVDFAAKGADSVAVVTDPADAGESVRHYNPATGSYGSVITSDTTQAGPYALIGVDDSAHRVVLMHTLNQDSYQIEVRNLSDGCLVGTPQLVRTAPGLVVGGRVDADPAPGLGAPVGQHGLPRRAAERGRRHRQAGHPGRAGRHGEGERAYYAGIDLDPSTGTVQLAHLPDSSLCFGSSANAVIDVSEATGAVTSARRHAGLRHQLRLGAGRLAGRAAELRELQRQLPEPPHTEPGRGEDAGHHQRRHPAPADGRRAGRWTARTTWR